MSFALSSIFESARVKLTFWYVFITCLVSCTFSVGLFTVTARELTRYTNLQQLRVERQLLDLENRQIIPHQQRLWLEVMSPEVERELLHRLRVYLAVINVLIAFGAAGLGYILAGKTLKPIETMMTQQKQFVSDASHELKTPLAILRTNIEVAQRQPKFTQADVHQLLSDQLEEAIQLQNLVETLLKLSQHQENSLADQGQVFDLKHAVAQALKQMESQAKSKSLKINSKLTEATVFGFEAALTEVAIILLDNAIKYSPAGQTIEVAVLLSPQLAQLVVRDSGPGIAPEHVPHIFDRFYRVDQSRHNSATQGHGLGLAIAHQIMKLHQGKLSVSSQVGQGSTFIASLPRHI